MESAVNSTRQRTAADDDLVMRRPLHTSTTPPISPMLDAGLARNIAKVDAAADSPSIATTTIESIGPERLPRAQVYRSEAQHRIGEAGQAATEGSTLMEAHLTNAEIDLILATREQQRARDELQAAELEHEQQYAIFTGQVPDADGIEWTNGDVAFVQQGVEHGRRARWFDRLLGRRAERTEEGVHHQLSPLSIAVLLAAGVLEFGLALNMWQTLLAGAAEDAGANFAVFAMTAGTAFALTLIPHGLISHFARGRRGKLSPTLLLVLVPIAVAVGLSILRQLYYAGRSKTAAEVASATAETSDASFSEGAASEALVALYDTGLITGLFVIVLLVSLIWIWIYEVPRYNPHAFRYSRAYAALLRARRRSVDADTALIEAEGARKLSEIGIRHNDETFRQYIEVTLPELEQLMYDEYEAELTRLKADPAFTAAMVVRQSEDRDRRQQAAGAHL
jgi:hypothetical protein